jgi:hypothetical protein
MATAARLARLSGVTRQSLRRRRKFDCEEGKKHHGGRSRSRQMPEKANE